MFVYTVSVHDDDTATMAHCALVTTDEQWALDYAQAYVEDTIAAGAVILDEREGDWLLEYPEVEGYLCSVKVEEHNL